MRGPVSKGIFRTLAACAIASLAGLGSATAGTPDGRYDHASQPEHTQNCNDCHRLGPETQWTQKVRVGKSGGTHAVCTKCHQAEWAKFDPRKGSPICESCHDLSGRRKNFKQIRYPPYRRGDESQFHLAKFSHKDHIREGNRGCEQCHGLRNEADAANDDASPDFGAVGHETCGNQVCHGGRVAPAMADCKACHTLGAPPATTPTEAAYRVDRGFSHQSHQTKAREARCGDCHTNVAVGAGQRIPRPEMINCESCHDGAKAFSALGSQCQTCHAGREDLAQPVRRPEGLKTYRHALHASKGVPLNCAQCHPSAANGRLEFPVPNKDHKPCAGCHAVEFRKKDSGLCFSCHEHNQPWRDNPKRTAFRSDSEFAVPIDHKAHNKVACDVCHAGPAGKPVQAVAAGLLAPSHQLCARCHEALQKPTMTECGRCHSLEAAQQAEAERAAGWSVGASFSHDNHRSRGKGFDCKVCHAGTEVAQGAPPHPPKAGCETCHAQGKDAFPITGFDCYRCHGAVQTASNQP